MKNLGVELQSWENPAIHFKCDGMIKNEDSNSQSEDCNSDKCRERFEIRLSRFTDHASCLLLEF